MYFSNRIIVIIIISSSYVNSLKKVSPHLWKQVLHPIQSLKTYIHYLVSMCWDLSFNVIPYMLQKNAQRGSYGHLNDSKVNFEKWHLMTVMEEYTAID